MATITSSDLAPAEKVHYSLSQVEFDLEGARGAYETDDLNVLRNARAHPWLKVEDAVAVDQTAAAEPLVVDFPRTAIDAGLPQKEEHFVGENGPIPTAETVAADAAQGNEPIVLNDPDDHADDEGEK
jgi:hypothetical protein